MFVKREQQAPSDILLNEKQNQTIKKKFVKSGFNIKSNSIGLETDVRIESVCYRDWVRSRVSRGEKK